MRRTDLAGRGRGAAWREHPRLVAVSDHVQMPLFRNVYALIANTGITALLGFAFWVVAARLYSTTDVGLASAAISAMTLLAGIALFNLEEVLVRFIPIAGQYTRRLIGSVYLLCSVAAVVVATLFLLGLDVWGTTLGFLRQQSGGAWFVVATVAWMIFIVQDGILVGLGRAIFVPIENAIFGLGKLILLLAFAGSGPFGIFRSWTVTAALVVIPFTALIFLRLVPRHMAAQDVQGGTGAPFTLQMLRRYATSDYIGSMFDLAAISLLPLLVTHQAGPEQNAFFYQSWIIAYTLILVANNGARALTVEAARDQSHLESYGRAVVGHTLKLLIPAAALVVILAPYLLRVFGPEYAAGGTTTLRILALAPIPHTIVLLALVTARLQHRLRELIAIQASTAILVLGTSIVLVGDLGGTGAAVGWLAGQSIVAAVLLATRLRWLLRPGAPGSAGQG